MLNKIFKSIGRVLKITFSSIYFLLAIVGIIAINDPYFMRSLSLSIEYWIWDISPMLDDALLWIQSL